MKPARIVVTIDTLTLEGFDARERRTIADALAQALTQRFADDAARGYRSASLDAWQALDVQRSAHSTPASLGAMLAERVWRGVTGTQQTQRRSQPHLQPQAQTRTQPQPQRQTPAAAPHPTPGRR
ncbi:hypothetical protein [Paraburkholderia pallida]|uniref:Uncharacterized protein n=1 Tax=Paraburkholderia pallida TaxID=2547399 RepID=A0A4P7D3Z4_9BURK|nr:hypothetical protein [Paraburkholderia pallida]QBR01445.1 hypothetical protein E1956_30110 [Paraburkholderia pallida]